MPGAGWNTYTAVGNKEDVSDIITNISPYDTPLYSRIGKTKAIAVMHEWLEDELGAPQVNQQNEGYTYFTMNVDERQRLFNYTQIMHRGIHVTDTQEVVLKYGLRSEIAYQLAKTLKEIAFDCEQTIVTQNTRSIGSMTPPTPRIFGGLPYWITTNVFTLPGSVTNNLTFTEINTALEQTWTGGGKPSILLVSPRNKRVISTFTANQTKYLDAGNAKKLTHMISVLETDFGTLHCMTDRFVPNDVVYGLSPEYIKKAFLRNFKTGDMPKMSDMQRKYVNGEWTLEMRAEKAHFMIDNCNGIVPDENG